MMLLVVNRFISKRISKPIRELDESVKAYEAGGKKTFMLEVLQR